MAQDTKSAQTIGRKPGKADNTAKYKHGWHGFSVGSRDDAYAAFERIEEEEAQLSPSRSWDRAAQ